MADTIETQLIVEAIAQGFDKLHGDLKDTGKAGDTADQGVSKLGVSLGNVATIAGGAAVAGLAALGAGLYSSVQAAAEAEGIQARLGAQIQAAGRAAETSVPELYELANTFVDISTFGDDAIASGLGILTTFQQVSEETRNNAAPTLVDMATAFGSVDTAAEKLGAALNDFDGFTKVARQIGGFTEEQEAAFAGFEESNDLIGYQNYLLDILAQKFGGQAAAAADTFSGRMTQLKDRIGEAQEEIGGAFLPALTELAEQAIPAVQDATEELVPLIQAMADEALPDLIEGVTGLIEQVPGWVSGLDEAYTATKKVFDIVFIIPNTYHKAGLAIRDLTGDIDTQAEHTGDVTYQVGVYNDSVVRLENTIQGHTRSVLAEGNAYDYLIPKVEAVTTSTQATTGAYDSMITASIRNENRMESYGERLGEVDEGQEAAEESARLMADAIGTIVTEAMDNSITSTSNLFEATGNLKAAQEELAASPWSQELQDKVATAEGEVTAAFDAMKESHRLMVVDILTQQAGLEGGFTQSQANIMVAMGLMNQEEANMALQSQETARQVGLVGDALIETFMEDGVISREEAALLEGAIAGVESGAFTAGEVIGAMARDDLGALISQSDAAIDRTSTLKDRLLETEGDYQVNVNVSVTGDAIPDVPSGSTGGGGQNPGSPQTPTFAGGGGMGGSINNFTMNNYGAMASQNLIAQFNLMRGVMGV